MSPPLLTSLNLDLVNVRDEKCGGSSAWVRIGTCDSAFPRSFNPSDSLPG